MISIASSANYAYLHNYEFGKIHQYLDWINLMSYDFHGPFKSALDVVTGHNSALYQDPSEPEPEMVVSDFNVAAAVEEFLALGVPASKINAGLAFYGRGYGGVPSTNNGLYQGYSGPAGKGTWEHGVFDYSDLKDNYVNKNGYTAHTDSLAGVPWLYSAAEQTMISYDDEHSIALKSAYIQQKSIGGAMFWEFSGDRHGDLLNSVYTTLGSR